MRHYGILSHALAFAFLAVAGVRTDTGVYAEDADVPPEIPAAVTKVAIEKKADKPADRAIAPPAASVPSIPPIQQNQSQLNAPPAVPPRNTLPNLSANSNAAFIPSFIGDGFSGNSTYFSNYENGEADNTKAFAIPAPGFGGGAGTVKLMELGSPIPRDRILMNYSYFSGVPLTLGTTNVNRFTPGFEKTLFGPNTSFELRMPMAITQGSFDHDSSEVSSNNAYQLGNLSMFIKTLLYRDDVFALSVGSGFTLPTANNGVLLSGDRGSRFQAHTDVLIKNQSPHIMPFFGGTYTPNDRWFTQSIVQVDVAARGNDVYTETNEGGALQYVGSLNDTTFLYASLATGYWLYRSPNGTSRLTGFSPIAELHINQSLQAADSVTVPMSFNSNAGGNSIGGGTSNVSCTNLVIGATMLFDEDKSLTVGYTSPIAGADRQFNGEFRLFFNWYFGRPLNRQTSIPF
jgi:hypothetical protein